MLEKPLFPTLFYETQISQDLCFAMLEEIKSKQNRIDTVSEATQIQPLSDYSTDFAHTIRIDHFWDYAVPDLQEQWKQFGKEMVNIHSWVSCYTGPGGHHPLHNHHGGYDNKLHYSAIIYLSNTGMTDFFSIDATANCAQHCENSEVGKVVFFPSIIPHQYRSEHYDGNARYTLPFNCEIVNLTQS
jgi:truncated hemoglobin YjbI